MTKTILHILNTGSYSGAENVIITIIEGFRKYVNEDIRFIYVSLDGSIRDILNKKNIEFEPMKKLTVKEVHRVINKYKPDLIHAHDFTASIICAAASGKIPVISHLHNNSPWIKSYCLNSFVYGLSCIKYKKILGVSSSVFDEFVFGKQIKNKTQVVGNPIDIANIVELADKAEDTESFDIVFLGRLTEQKNPLRFINIIKQLANEDRSVRAVMIGDGEMRDDVENEIKKYHLESNITLKGFLDNPYGILKNSKVLCIPSSWEGFGLVAVEALALGKPVTASPVGGLRNIVTNECGMVCNTDEEFIDEIYKLISQNSYYTDKSLSALKRADEINNIREYILNMEKVYESYRR